VRFGDDCDGSGERVAEECGAGGVSDGVYEDEVGVEGLALTSAAEAASVCEALFAALKRCAAQEPRPLRHCRQKPRPVAENRDKNGARLRGCLPKSRSLHFTVASLREASAPVGMTIPTEVGPPEVHVPMPQVDGPDSWVRFG